MIWFKEAELYKQKHINCNFVQLTITYWWNMNKIWKKFDFFSKMSEFLERKTIWPKLTMQQNGVIFSSNLLILIFQTFVRYNMVGLKFLSNSLFPYVVCLHQKTSLYSLFPKQCVLSVSCYFSHEALFSHWFPFLYLYLKLHFFCHFYAS